MTTATQVEPQATSKFRLGEIVNRRVKVLLAEDDGAMRSLLSNMLRKAGYEVAEAASGWELLERIGLSLSDGPTVPYDLIVSDIRMPGVTGLEVLASLRESDLDVPVVLITAFGDIETNAEAHRLGAAAVFNKPFDPRDLRLLVEALVPPQRMPS